MEKGRLASLSFQGRKCVFEVSFVFCLGTFESQFLQNLESASVWPSFSPCPSSLFTLGTEEHKVRTQEQPTELSTVFHAFNPKCERTLTFH